MAGGKGTRLRPLTSNQPKPMVPVVGKPCLEHVLEHLRRNGVREIVVTLAYMPQAIRSYFGDGETLGVELSYSVEPVPLGTAGSVAHAAARLDETFLVLSGDALCDADLGALVAAHRASGAAATIGLKPVGDPVEYGLVVTDEAGRVERFLEKPTWGQVFTDTVNTGIYVLEPDVLRGVPPDRELDFAADLFPLLLERGAHVQGQVLDGYWLDIGTLEQLRVANVDALDGRVTIELPGIRLAGDVHVADDVSLDELGAVEGPAFIGPGCRLAPGASVGAYTVLAGGVSLQEGAVVSRSLIGARTHVGRGAVVEGAIVGSGCDLRDRVCVHEAVAIGDEVTVGAEATIFPGVRVYPFKEIESGVQIHESVVWESRVTRSVFGRDGVVGRVDVDLTPEIAVRLAAALGSALRRGDRVVASRDPPDACRMVQRALISGLTSTGIEVADLRVSPAAVTRHVLKTQALAAGVHVSRSTADPELVQVRVFEPPGIAMSTRLRHEIEKQLGRQEFRRVAFAEVGGTTYPARVRESYAQDIVDRLDADAVRTRGFRIAVDYGHAAAAFTLPLVLGPLGVEAVAIHGSPFAAPGPDRVSPPLRRLVTSVGADLGIALDRAAERLRLVDERGEDLADDLALLLVIHLLATTGKRGEVVVPVTATRLVETLAGGSSLSVRRTRHSLSALTGAAAEPGVMFAGAPTGGFVFPDVVPGYDAVAAACKLLDLLAADGRPLSEIVAGLPRPSVVARRVPCPWDRRGTVMRRLAERLADRRVETVDGVRAEDGRGWVQAVPDVDEPVLLLFAEGADETASAGLAVEMADAVGTLVQGERDGRRTVQQASS